ncbi:unnamed protein product [Orchesella dallaii]|uniref:Uncharacterized protein n=1 Tax=Orchesella dallaii TaxID=48710 RepID=A0ABP1Q850_9HEXA
MNGKIGISLLVAIVLAMMILQFAEAGYRYGGYVSRIIKMLKLKLMHLSREKLHWMRHSRCHLHGGSSHIKDQIVVFINKLHFKKSGTCKKDGKGTDHVDVGEAGSRTPIGEGVREGAIFPPTLSADGVCSAENMSPREIALQWWCTTMT